MINTILEPNIRPNALVVDDDDGWRNHYSKKFDSLGFRVDAFDNA